MASKIQIRQYQFSPSLIPSLATIVALALFIRLGFWQLDRAEQKQTIIDNQASRSEMLRFSLNEIDINSKDLNYTPVELMGNFDNRYNILLDNRIYDRRAGYHVLTVFHDQTSGQDLLVNRGWVDGMNDRTRLPNIPALDGQFKLRGHIYKPPDNAITLADDDYQAIQWPFVVQKVDLPSLSGAINGTLLPFTIRLDPEPDVGQFPAGFVRDWQLKKIQPEKHLGYAFQWFAMALVLCIIYLKVNLKRNPNNSA